MKSLEKALAPFTVTQTYRQWDAIISVTGFGGGENALRGPGGRAHLRPIYGRSSNYQRPDLGAFPFFGPGADHHRAIANGGAQEIFLTPSKSEVFKVTFLKRKFFHFFLENGDR